MNLENNLEIVRKNIILKEHLQQLIKEFDEKLELLRTLSPDDELLKPVMVILQRN